MANHANGAQRPKRAPMTAPAHLKRPAAPAPPGAANAGGAAPGPKRRARSRPPAVAVQIAERDARTSADDATPAALEDAAIAAHNGGEASASTDTLDDVGIADADDAVDASAVDANAGDQSQNEDDWTGADDEDTDAVDMGNDWQDVDDGDTDAPDDDMADEREDGDDETDDADAERHATGMPGEANYYATLGVEPDATHDELRQAYRRLAKLWHPDRYASAPPALRAQAERRMRALNAAYFVVGDAIRRHLYDQRQTELATSDSAGRRTRRATTGATDYTGYMAWSGASQGRQGERLDNASENPNGAGVFFGALALVVGVGLFVGATQSGSAWVFVFGGVILVGLIILALIFSSHTSPFANAATRLMEGEPRGFGDPYVAAGAVGWRGTRYADRAPQRTAGVRRGARHGARSATRSQAPGDGTNGRRPTPPDAPTLNEEPTTSEATPATQATPINATSVTTNADAQPPDVTDEAVAFARFQQDVVDAVEALPAEFREQMGNIVVRVADEPDAATLRKMRTGKGHTLFGLYEGVPLTKQGATKPPPEIVTIYRGPITRACQGDPARIREQARRTVFHEVAHHFGIDHDDMPEWIK